MRMKKVLFIRTIFPWAGAGAGSGAGVVAGAVAEAVTGAGAANLERLRIRTKSAAPGGCYQTR